MPLIGLVHERVNKYLFSQVDEQEERKKRQKTEHKEVSVDEEVRVMNDITVGLSRASYEKGHNFFDTEHNIIFVVSCPKIFFTTRAHNYLAS